MLANSFATDLASATELKSHRQGWREFLEGLQKASGTSPLLSTPPRLIPIQTLLITIVQYLFQMESVDRDRFSLDIDSQIRTS